MKDVSVHTVDTVVHQIVFFFFFFFFFVFFFFVFFLFFFVLLLGAEYHNNSNCTTHGTTMSSLHSPTTVFSCNTNDNSETQSWLHCTLAQGHVTASMIELFSDS